MKRFSDIPDIPEQDFNFDGTLTATGRFEETRRRVHRLSDFDHLRMDFSLNQFTTTEPAIADLASIRWI